MIQVAIPAELEPFVQGVVRSGSYHDPAEVVGEASRCLSGEATSARGESRHRTA